MCPSYDPNRGDSVLEKEFWYRLGKTYHRWHGAIDQFQLELCRVDCLIDCDGRSVVVELDGKAFHKADADARRDAHVLKNVDAVIRIPFGALWFLPDATFDALATWFPRFKTRGNHIMSIPISEFHEERRRAEEDYNFDDWFGNTEAYQVWHVEGNTAWIGTPKQMLYGAGGFAIVKQDGTGSKDVLDRLYRRTGCSRLTQ